MSAEVPAVRAGQTWENVETGWQVDVLHEDVRGTWHGEPMVWWHCRTRRGSRIRGDRFDGKRYRFVSGPTS